MTDHELADLLREAASRLRCTVDGGLCAEYVDDYYDDERCHCPTCSLYKRVQDELGPAA